MSAKATKSSASGPNALPPRMDNLRRIVAKMMAMMTIRASVSSVTNRRRQQVKIIQLIMKKTTATTAQSKCRIEDTKSIADSAGRRARPKRRTPDERGLAMYGCCYTKCVREEIINRLEHNSIIMIV